MRFTIVSIFPESFTSLLSSSLLGKAVETGKLTVDFVDPRDFTEDRHRTVDDSPYGGGDGMVIKPDPLVAAIESVPDVARRVLLTPQGAPLDQRALERLRDAGHVMLVCGRYEGFDERIRDFVDEEISLGDFVLNGGEVAAMAVVDGVTRLVPGVVGNAGSLESESHNDGLLEYPQYTRPREFRGRAVPEVLLGGDHEKIRRWRRAQMLERTRRRRPDLWRSFSPTDEDRALLAAGSPAPGPDDDRARQAARTYVALLHHPVLDREGARITTAITNLDIHDIARSTRTYGLAGYLIVTPLSSQQELARRIMGHWQQGHGASYNPMRKEALSGVEVVSDLAAATAWVAEREGAQPLHVATSAAKRPGQLSFDAMRQRFNRQDPLIIMLGTGWGLADDALAQAQLALVPIEGVGDYNHLSVRSAAAILLDRLFGMRD